ncbi:hypothetical protein [Streptomyces noursei]|uniref:hypothetical protein n=1 Tax=Streptomyces noursei TaxID=1971 RepID=UPI00294FF69F|nr:hypothetical protein [Streptomyces noursei]
MAHALAAGLLPQWRARRPASRRVAASLGFEELGHQLSIEMARQGTDWHTAAHRAGSDLGGRGGASPPPR